MSCPPTELHSLASLLGEAVEDALTAVGETVEARPLRESPRNVTAAVRLTGSTEQVGDIATLEERNTATIANVSVILQIGSVIKMRGTTWYVAAIEQVDTVLTTYRLTRQRPTLAGRTEIITPHRTAETELEGEEEGD